jgi:uncharacterized membrane protein YidH (DUF202 family)
MKGRMMRMAERNEETMEEPSSDQLSLERTILSHERTLMSWVRTNSFSWSCKIALLFKASSDHAFSRY